MDKTFSGQFRVRIPKSLHATLSELARIEGVSLNTYIIMLLSSRSAVEMYRTGTAPQEVGIEPGRTFDDVRSETLLFGSTVKNVVESPSIFFSVSKVQ